MSWKYFERTARTLRRQTVKGSARIPAVLAVVCAIGVGTSSLLAAANEGRDAPGNREPRFNAVKGFFSAVQRWNGERRLVEMLPSTRLPETSDTPTIHGEEHHGL